jgi:hypothetical protein
MRDTTTEKFVLPNVLITGVPAGEATDIFFE